MTSRSPTPALLVVLAALAATAAPAARAETHATCTGFIERLPAVISTQGVWCMARDLSTSMASGRAVEVTANNVTIDCNGYKLGGLGAGPETATVGIFASGRLNLTVRHCNLRGFRVGIETQWPGGGHLFVDNRLDNMTGSGMNLGGEGMEVRGNRIFDTGGTPGAGTAYGIRVSGLADVRDNTIENVVPALYAGYASAIGIHVSGAPGSTIVGNRIRGLVSAGEGGSIGISGYYSPYFVIDGNHVIGTGELSRFGIYCASLSGRAVRNVVVGFTTALDTCTDAGNTY